MRTRTSFPPGTSSEPGPLVQDEGGAYDETLPPPSEGATGIEPEADERRRRRIAERAYRRAEQRGFAPGRELDDWLAAEREDADEDPRDITR
jgi:hypothetical protein